MTDGVIRYRRNVVEGSPRPVAEKAPLAAGFQTASRTSLGKLGVGLAIAGDEMVRWGEEVATAEAKEADSTYQNTLNDLLYGENGYLYSQGGDAVGGVDGISSAIDEAYRVTMDGLEPMAQNRAKAALDARRERAKTSVAQHGYGARTGYLNDADTARINTAINSSIYDPSKEAESLRLISQTASDLADRNGWAPEVKEAYLAAEKDKIYHGTAMRIANVDPVLAVDYINANKENMTGGTVAALEQKLVPIAKEARGRAKGSSYYDRSNVSGTAQEAMARLEGLTGQTLNVTSAHRDSAHNAQVGGAKNSQHIQGNAFDVDVSDLSIEERQALIVKAREAGFGGIGVYGNSLHFDVGPTRTWGPSYGSESVPSWAAAAVQSPRGSTAPDMQDILNLPDIEREAALQEIDLRSKIAMSEQKAKSGAAANAGYAAVLQGQPLSSLDIQTAMDMGRTEYNALLGLEGTLAAGANIITDPLIFNMLTNLQENAPHDFHNLVTSGEIMRYSDQISPSDMENFMQSGSKPVIGAPISGIMSQAEGLGVHAALIDGDDETRLHQFQYDMTLWAKDNPVDSKDQTKVQEEIKRAMTDILIRPRGRDEQSGKLFEIDFDGKPYDPNDDLTINDARDSTIKINGNRVEQGDILEIARRLAIDMDRDPTLEEVLIEMIDRGIYADKPSFFQSLFQ